VDRIPAIGANAYYGLCPSKVASLQLNSIDWKTGTLRVEQRKTHSVLLLPLANNEERDGGSDVLGHAERSIGSRRIRSRPS
jgi:integrase